jgi:hypothetical protein
MMSTRAGETFQRVAKRSIHPGFSGDFKSFMGAKFGSRIRKDRAAIENTAIVVAGLILTTPAILQ